jgi:hypothetical protein
MKKARTLIGAVTAAHFVLCLAVLGLIRLTGLIFLLQLYLWLSLPMSLLPDMPWFPFNWFTFGLAMLLNSGMWGVTFGLLIYAVRQRLHRPVA